VVLLLQQGGHVPPDGHLLGQVLVLGTDPAPQLLQQAQQAGPPLRTRLQVGPGTHGQRSEVRFEVWGATRLQEIQSGIDN